MIDIKLTDAGKAWILEHNPRARVEDFLADLLTIADVEIKPIALCPKDCTACPEPMLVEPQRET